ASTDLGTPDAATDVAVAVVQEIPDVSPLDVRDEADRRGASLPELEVRLKAARRVLKHREALAKRGSVTTSLVDDAQTAVEILEARLEAQRKALRDELERLQGRLTLKKVEEMAIQARAKPAEKGNSLERSGEIAVKRAEAAEVAIRI